MTTSPAHRSSIVSTPLWSSLFCLLLGVLPLMGCAAPDPAEAPSVRQRVEQVAGCVYDHIVGLYAHDTSIQPALDWNADHSVATITVRDAAATRATYHVEWRWDTVSIETQVTELAANEADIVAREAAMHDICLSTGGF